jgi:hypothetical protein
VTCHYRNKLAKVSINSAVTVSAVEYNVQDRLIGALRAEEYDKRDSGNSPSEITDTFKSKLRK